MKSLRLRSDYMDLEDKDLEEFAISANAAGINLEELEIHGANRIITAGGIRSMGKKLDTLRSLGVDLEHLRGSSVLNRSSGTPILANPKLEELTIRVMSYPGDSK